MKKNKQEIKKVRTILQGKLGQRTIVTFSDGTKQTLHLKPTLKVMTIDDHCAFDTASFASKYWNGKL